MANNKKKTQAKTVELEVGFALTKSLDDYESVKIHGGVTIPIQITDEEDYAKQYKHWLGVIRKQVVDQAYKYFRAVQKAKIDNLESRDDLNEKK